MEKINLDAILDAMEKECEAVFAADASYHAHGKRGMYVVELRDARRENQWNSALRNFGAVWNEPGAEGEIIINNGDNFDATVHGKIAYSRRTLKNSGAHYYQVLGSESWWKGAIISSDKKCICAFSGLKGVDDVKIAEAGIAEYNRQKGLR
ncbi:MAG: hypothetical protein Ta2A_16450 [Treponemataceae bacterium]|nr:MAG: hypothetical protein Ta2A_16450 [Treponemataceae bacterium]